MKITVRHQQTEVIIDRPSFTDYNVNIHDKAGRANIIADTIIPMLTEAIKAIKELNQND